MAASPFHAAVLIATLACVALVATELLGPWTAGEQDVLPALLMLVAAIVSIALSPRLRRATGALVAQRIAEGRAWDIVLVTAALALMPCATSGAAALWHWHRDGGAGLTALVLHQREVSAVAAGVALLGPAGYAVFLVTAPLFEELCLRGFMLRALEREWGWLAAAIATASLGALYWPALAPALASGLALAALRRRAAALAAPMLAHTLASIATPLVASRWAVPAVIPEHAGLGDWAFPIACLAVNLVLLAGYFALAQREPALALRARPAMTQRS